MKSPVKKPSVKRKPAGAQQSFGPVPFRVYKLSEF
jgi:hypothetical protein